jgi:hypothetical protein
MCKKSESIIEIAKALCKFNGEIQRIEKDSTNPHFKNKYASLDNIIDDIRPILTKYGLSIIQMPGGDGENFKMSTLLIHESGEWIESDPIVMKPVKNDPQGIGSCATYARRYSLSAFLSLNTGEDDDGNDASKANQQSQQTYNKPPVTNQQTQQSSTSNPAAQTQQKSTQSATGGSTVARVYKLREELGWGWPDLTNFASDVLQREIKYLKTGVKTDEEWQEIEKAILVSKAG